MGLAPVAQFGRGPLWGQTWLGACWSEGLAAAEHVPDRLGEGSGELDLGDTGAALAAEPFLRSLVAVFVGGVAGGVLGRLDQPPAPPLPPGLGQGAAPVGLAGTV